MYDNFIISDSIVAHLKIHILILGPICEEPGRIKNGYATVINGSPIDERKDDMMSNAQIQYRKKNAKGGSYLTELQHLEYKCNKGFTLWGNSILVCNYNNRYMFTKYLLDNCFIYTRM